LYGRYEKNSVKNVLLQIKFWKRHVSNSKGGEAYQASYVRKVWRHQWGNQNQYIEEQTTQKDKIKSTLKKKIFSLVIRKDYYTVISLWSEHWN
jgi:hypothetical protein